jgi:hypothetical protein
MHKALKPSYRYIKMPRKIKNSRKETFIEKIGYKKNKELYWILAFMVFLIILLFATSALFKSRNSFNYKGLLFTKEMFGEIPVNHHYYYFTDPITKTEYQYNLYLRIDPRENNVSMEGKTNFIYGKTVYFAINSTGISNCSTSQRDLATLAAFFTNNLFPIQVGLANREEANASNNTRIDCDIYPRNSVIRIQSGNETKIYKEENCYIIQVANCQILESVEKFEVQSILDAKEREKAKASSKTAQ